MAGKLADMVLLSDDPFRVSLRSTEHSRRSQGEPTRIPPERIKDIKIEMTILGGEVVWEA